jgi:hypothetical protein
MSEGWCNTELQFQPILDWRHFHGHGGANGPSAPTETPGRFGPNFEDCDRLLFWRLRGTRRHGSNLRIGRCGSGLLLWLQIVSGAQVGAARRSGLYFGLVATPSSLGDRLTRNRVLPLAIQTGSHDFV